MRFDKLNKELKVAQYCENGEIKFVKPIRYIEKYVEEYIKYNNKDIEIITSCNHNMIAKNKENKKNKIYKIPSINFINNKLNSYYMINCGTIKDNNNQKLTAMQKVGIMLQADGCLYKKNKDCATWKLEFSKERKIEEFKKICQEANLDYKEYKKRKFKKEEWNDSYKFTIKVPNINYKKLDNFLEIPKNLEYAESILTEIEKWDCYRTDHNVLEYDTVIYENAKFVQTVAIMANKKVGKFMEIKRKNDKHKTIYRIYIGLKQNIYYGRFKKQLIQEKIKVFCVEVPSNMIICRKNNFIFVTGNCQNISSNPTQITQYEKILNNLVAEYRISLSATPRRQDGLTNSMFALCGKIKHEITSEEVSDKTIKAIIQPIITNYEIPDNCLKYDGTINYVKIPTAMAEDKERNELILKLLKENKDEYCLILSDRLDGLRYLHEQLGEGLIIDGSMTTKKAKSEREQAIQKMRNKEEHYLFASFALAKEGLDIKPLNRLFLIAQTKNSNVLIQSVGRIERKDENKETPIVYDFVDKDIYYQKSYKLRKTIYKKNNNKILEEIRYDNN